MICPLCEGSGFVDGLKFCPECHGLGAVEVQ
jgi:DnaJ-class molecular chaperone